MSRPDSLPGQCCGITRWVARGTGLDTYECEQCRALFDRWTCCGRVTESDVETPRVCVCGANRFSAIETARSAPPSEPAQGIARPSEDWAEQLAALPSVARIETGRAVVYRNPAPAPKASLPAPTTSLPGEVKSCLVCGADFVPVLTRNGATLPLDPESTPLGKVVIRDGVAVLLRREVPPAGEARYSLHSDTCVFSEDEPWKAPETPKRPSPLPTPSPEPKPVASLPGARPSLPDTPWVLLVDLRGVIRRIGHAEESMNYHPGPEAARVVAKACRAIRARVADLLQVFESALGVLAVDDGTPPTWRHQLFPQYKAGRIVPNWLEGLILASRKLVAGDYPVVWRDGWEADDVLYTFTLRAREAGQRVVIATRDKDLWQLICNELAVYDHQDKAMIREPEVSARFGVSAGQLADYLALTGDQVDGIPGVPGIGPKSAANLLQEHGTLEAILTAEVPGKLGEKLREHAETARLCRRLVGLREVEA